MKPSPDSEEHEVDRFTRRCFLQGATALGLYVGLEHLAPAYAWQTGSKRPIRDTPSAPERIDLQLHTQTFDIAGQRARAMTINGSVPGPLVRLREGQTATLRVTNQLEDMSALHWHGLLVPANMDGVPGVSFAGIQPGKAFTYQFRVKQSGTYWYHSHSALQEQSGVYGPLIIDPAEPEPFNYDRDYVVMLSDWTFENPHRVLAKLKKQSGYYNFQKQTGQSLIRDAAQRGVWNALTHRLMWGRMRMDPTDIADVTGDTYTYLMNGLSSDTNWTALFRPGERVRLRFINGAAMTYFDIRLPGLPLTVIQADGQNVQPVTIDEFRIAPAETYDVIVEPQEDRAYTIFAETMDRSGYARGSLAPRQGMTAPIPEPRSRPLREMADMGMHEGHGKRSKPGQHVHQASPHGMSEMKRGADFAEMSPPHNSGVPHGPDHHGPGAAMVAAISCSRLDEPGVGLENTERRVLVYSDLRSLTPGSDPRAPAREIELHLTGVMERYMWSFDGKKFSEVKEPIAFHFGERLRLTLVNDTMMDHPIHLHGMWMELDNGTGLHKPKKHTLSVKPAERVSVDITADALGQWAFHCHLLYHMEAGMFRLVSVSKAPVEVRG